MYEIDESFSYTTLFMLKLNLVFGNKRNLSLIEALEGRRVLEMSIREDSICFSQIDESCEFMDFLDECSELVYYKDGIIYLRDNVSVYDIEVKIGKIRPTRYLDYCISIFKYLGINKPIEFIYKFYDLESKIEELYMNNSGNINDNALEKLFKERDNILKDIYYGDDDYLDVIIKLQDELYENLEDRYVVFPINASRYEKSDHYDERTDLIEFLSSPMQSSIFTNFPLNRTKVKYDFYGILDNIAEEEINDVSDYKSNKDLFDATEDYFDATVDNSEYDDETNYETKMFQDEFTDGIGASCNLTRKNIIFSLSYIKELEDIKKKFKDQENHIDNIILRLKYLNDNIDLKLYEKSIDELDDVINSFKTRDDGDYLVLADEVMYFINEIFNMYYDRYFIEKLVFIKTYYDLTGDNEIVDYINSFKCSRLYNYVYNMIIGDDKNKVKRK